MSSRGNKNVRNDERAAKQTKKVVSIDLLTAIDLNLAQRVCRTGEQEREERRKSIRPGIAAKSKTVTLPGIWYNFFHEVNVNQWRT